MLTGLQFSLEFFEVFFEKRVTFANFQAAGKMDQTIILLKLLNKNIAVISLSALTSFVELSVHFAAFEVSNYLILF